tara:strand:+ start:506 stop:1681 length:1176 start_codon:yes stop_codon:yes gene_type:complete
MESSKPTADCMSCHRELNMDFISQVTPKIFYAFDYSKKRAEDLLSQERSLLPDTQHLVEAQKQREKRNVQIFELHREVQNLRERSREIKREIYRLQTAPIGNLPNKEKKERKKFIMGCPAENCRGFLSQAWKCGTCDIYVCPHCREIKGGREDDDHVCDKDAVATAKLLAEETKPCPKCAVPIYKISGCDQMWCVECQTPFSWKTGQVITGIIHNPHFYQWQRNQNGGVAPRVPGDVPCGGACDGLPWTNVLTVIIARRQEKCPNWQECHRLIGHIRDIEMRRYPALTRMNDNTDLRLEFLTNKIDEKTWLRQLKMRQKRMEKNRAINQVLEVFHISATEIFRSYASGELTELNNSLSNLRVYVDRQLMKIKQKFTVKVPYITDKWQILSK